jgi:hypothetical protein
MTTKKLIGLRPVKYSSLKDKFSIGLFNSSIYKKQALAESLDHANKLVGFIDENVIWGRWDRGENPLEKIDYVVLFSNIPSTDLKEIWYMTQCDVIMPYKSFKKIYQQCVTNTDIIWINVASRNIETIDQKIFWDRIEENVLMTKPLPPTPPPLPPTPPPLRSSPVISAPLHKPMPYVPPLPVLPKRVAEEIESSTEEGESDSMSSSSEEEYIVPPPRPTRPAPTLSAQKTESETRKVTVRDITNEIKRTYVVSLPKKITHVSDVESVPEKKEEVDPATCIIL